MDPRALADLQGTEDDTERFARMTPEERLDLFLQLCELTDSITRGRPDAEKLLAPTPRSREAEELWQRLIERARRERDRG